MHPMERDERAAQATEGVTTPANERRDSWWRDIVHSVIHPRRTFAGGRRPGVGLALLVGTTAMGAGMVSDRTTQLLGDGLEPSDALFESLALGAGALVAAPAELLLSAVGLHVVLWLFRAEQRSFKTTLSAIGMSRSAHLLAVPLLVLSLGLATSSPKLADWVISIGRALQTLWGLFVLGMFLHVLHGFGKLKAGAAVLGPILLAVFGALGVRLFALEAFKVPAGSMWPTLNVHDHVFVTKGRYEPRRGGLIVFEYPRPADDPEPAQDFIKRVVGLPGDTVSVENGSVVINGKAAQRCKVGSHTWQGNSFVVYVEILDGLAYLTAEDPSHEARNFGPLELGHDELFVLGDNRDNSFDSRMWPQGPGVPVANVKGSVWFVWLSFLDDTRAVDWSRIGSKAKGRPMLPAGAGSALEAHLEKCLLGWTPPE